MMVPAGKITEDTFQELARSSRARRHDRRRRQLELPRLAAAARGGRERGHPLRRRRRLGRGLGARGRLLPDGRRRRGAVARLEPIFRVARAEGRLRARGPSGRRALREDGPQRDRVRADAGLRGGLRGDRESEFDLDLHEIAGIWRYGSVVRSWLLELLAAAFDARGRQAREDQGLRRGLRRRPLDDRRGYRGGRPRAGDQRRALRPLRLPPGRVVRGQGERRAPQPVRRPCRAGARNERGASKSGTRCSTACRCAGGRSPARSSSSARQAT